MRLSFSFVAARLAGQQEGFRVDELHLAGGHRTGAELVFEAADANAVAGAVATGPQYQERRHAAAGILSALRLGQHDEHLTVAVGRKPLETIK